MSVTSSSNNEQNYDNIVGLDDEEKEPQSGFLVGWNNITNEEVTYNVDLISLMNLSEFAKASIEGDMDHNKIFRILGKFKERGPNESKLSSHIVVKKISEWINHYSSSLSPPIIKKPIRSKDIATIIKTTLNEKKESTENINKEVTWYTNFFDMSYVEVFQLIGSSNYMAILNGNQKGGLMEVCCVYIAASIKGRPSEEIKEMLKLE